MDDILLVDNDTDILDLLRLGLEDRGYTVRTATNGLDALKLLRHGAPEVVITDLIMPDIDGEKLLRIIRSTPEWGAVRTVALSGVAAEAPSIRSRVPCDVYIAKGPLKDMLELLGETLKDFAHMRRLSADQALGVDRIYARRVTRELFEVREQYVRLLDLVNEGLCATTVDGYVLWGNQTFYRTIGKPEEIVLGRRISSYVSGVDTLYEELAANDSALPRVKSRWRATADEKKVTARFLNRETSVSETRVFLAWQPGWENPDDFSADRILETTSYPLLTVDQDLLVTYANPQAVGLLATDGDSLIGEPIAKVLKHRDSGWERWLRTLISGAVDAGKSGSFFRTRLQTADENRRRIDVMWHALPDRPQGIAGLLGELIDPQDHGTDIILTESEHERQALLHELQHRVNDNLQIIASLVRISSPDEIESRIATLIEVFDEVYRGPNFSTVQIPQVLESIVGRMLMLDTESVRRTISVEQESRNYPIRQALPISLLVNEVLFHLTQSSRNGEIDQFRIALKPDPVKGRVLQIDAAARKGSSALTGEDSQSLCSAAEPMISLLVQQLAGSYGLHTSPDNCELVVRFPAPNL